jgi:tetratricopeptide (TPR) repeat protein
MRKTFICSLLVLLALPLAAQQLRLPRVSPNSTLTQTVGLTDITIKYSRPGVKGRQIWGGLVPYDTIWRTGANEATTINFSDDVMINGQKLAKGNYALFTIPTKDQWSIVFNSQAEQWGAFTHDKSKDVLTVTAKPEKAEFREWMEFEIPEMSTDTAKIAIRWENIAVPFMVDTMSTEHAMAAAKKTIAAIDNTRWQLPLSAADFAFQNGKMEEARMWLDQALAVKENTRTLWLKARLENKEGKKAEAKKTVDAALAKATDAEKDLAAEIKRQSDAWGK